MKLYKLYYNTSYDFRDETEIGGYPLTKQQLELEKLLKDPTNYYTDFSFSLTYDQIKDIYENKENELRFADLVRYIKSNDYIYLLKQSHIDLSSGITNPSNKYNNILTDLRLQMIPSFAMKDTSIAILFDLETKSDLKHIKKHSFGSYFGNVETYNTFKELLKIYIDGIKLILYKDKILTYNELKDNYLKIKKNRKEILDSKPWLYAELISDLVNETPDMQELRYNCISINDPQNLNKDPLGKLEINLELINAYKNNKIIKPHFITELYKYNRVQKELLDL